MRYRAMTRRAALGRSRKPFRQGDLDGLCGIYSTVNSVRALCPEIDNNDASYLFDHLIQQLPVAGANAPVAIANGIGTGELGRLLAKAIRYVAAEHDIALGVARLPKALRGTADIKRLWSALADAVSPTCVAVIGLSGKHDHWTVAAQVTPEQMYLYDSGEMSLLRRRHCTLRKSHKRTSIGAAHMFLITRSDAE